MGELAKFFTSKRDKAQQKKAEEDRRILNDHINRLEGVTFGREGLMAFGNDRVIAYEKVKKDIIRNFQDVDPSDYDPLELDDEITALIGEYQDAVEHRSIPRVNTCLKALKYASIARKLHMPVKADRDKIMQKKMDDIAAYRTIIEYRKNIASSEESLNDQKNQLEKLDTERQESKVSYQEFRDNHQAAYEELKRSTGLNGTASISTLSVDAQTMQGYIDDALDLRDEVSYLNQIIARNERVIKVCYRIIQRQEVIISQRQNAIDEETLKKSEKAQEHLKDQMANLDNAIDRMRASHHKATLEMENLSRTEERRKNVMQSLRAFEKMEEEEEQAEVLEAEGKTRLAKEAAEKAQAKRDTLAKLRQEREAYVRERQEAEEETRAYEEELDKELNKQPEEVENEEEEEILEEY